MDQGRGQGNEGGNLGSSTGRELLTDSNLCMYMFRYIIRYIILLMVCNYYGNNLSFVSVWITPAYIRDNKSFVSFIVACTVLR